MRSGDKGFVISSSAESAMTWFFDGLVLITGVAGIVGQAG